MTRPEPPEERYDGMVWVPVPEDAGWRLATRERRCRMVSGYPRVRCPNMAVAELNRHRRVRSTRTDNWWAYCAEHLYGRWVEDGVIMCWRPRPIR